MPRRPITVLLVLPLLAGCGGSVVRGERLAEVVDPHGGAHAVWVARANSICQERAAAVQKLRTPSTQSELIDAGSRIAAAETVEHSRLARLRPPVQDRDEVGAFLDSLERIPREIERVRSALELRSAADLAGAKAALTAARRDANARARRLGLACRY